MSDEVTIELRYKRTAAGQDTVTGHVTVKSGVHGLTKDFENVHFNWAFTRLAESVREAPPEDLKEVTVTRIDVPGGHTTRLADDLVELLRTDITRALRMLNPPPRRVVISDRAAPPSTELIPKLRAGVDTLAAAFGHDVYVAAKEGNLIESPLDGRWAKAHRPYQDVRSLSTDDVRRVYGAASFEGSPIRGCDADGQDYSKWAVFCVKDLLAADAEEFYLPRQWNAAAWISKADLKRRYTRYCEETRD